MQMVLFEQPLYSAGNTAKCLMRLPWHSQENVWQNPDFVVY